MLFEKLVAFERSVGLTSEVPSITPDYLERYNKVLAWGERLSEEEKLKLAKEVIDYELARYR